jgi:hypothetical protein
LKGAEGFGPEYITVVDDYGGTNNTFTTRNVIIIVTFNGDGTPTTPKPGAMAQDGQTDLPVWLTYGERLFPNNIVSPVGDTWETGRFKNPLYVAPDNEVHLADSDTEMALNFGYMLEEGYGDDEDDGFPDKNFDRIVRAERGVYVQDEGYNKPDGGRYQAHIYLTIPELVAIPIDAAI